MEESIRYGHQGCLLPSHRLPPTPWRRCQPGSGRASWALAPFTWALLCWALVASPLHHLTCFSRSLEQEISFDFGPSGEFAYLYSQCYELTTNEYILALEGLGVGWDQGGRCRGGHWADKNLQLISAVSSLKGRGRGLHPQLLFKLGTVMHM